MGVVHIWRQAASVRDLAGIINTETRRPLHLAMVVQNVCPEWTLPPQPLPPELDLQRTLNHALPTLQFTAPTHLRGFADGVDVYLLPPQHAARLHDFFAGCEVCWHGEPLPQTAPAAPKPWFAAPPHTPPERVLVIGAGIAGAATAYELAQRGVPVCVLEADAQPAQAASGNYQGLLYAKISPHATAQTELLLGGYGHSRRLLETLLPEQQHWGGHGVLHLDHNAAEAQRNRALGQQTQHRHLYRHISAAEATQLAGIDIAHSALFWQQGVWLNPAALIRALLAHPLISLHTGTRLLALQHRHNTWHADTTQGSFSGSHIVFCCGADNPHTPLIRDFPFQMIRGQTSLAASTAYSSRLKVALSAQSYIAPAWQGQHCYGASFINNDSSSQWQERDEQDNRRALAELHPELHRELCTDNASTLRGHAAVRCDSHDHLPLVGALGDPHAMRQVYAKLALDKNYRINTPCPYLPNAYTNTAHGSRGLATAPLCAAELAAQICGEASVLSAPLRQALHPNRLIIRQIVRKTA